jgi:hypothetical protein
MNKNDKYTAYFSALKGEFGLIARDLASGTQIVSIQENTSFPLASAAKLAMGFAVSDKVKKGEIQWGDKQSDIQFDPKEDSEELYPHFQGLEELELGHLVEVMIACHDNFLAKRIARHLGGWSVVNNQLQTYYPQICINENPRDMDKNIGNLEAMAQLLYEIVQGYRQNASLWHPIIAGMVRQNYKTNGIPSHHLANMTGGLSSALVDIGILGCITKNDSLLYIVAGKNLPDRSVHRDADEAVAEIIRSLYKSLDVR